MGQRILGHQPAVGSPPIKERRPQPGFRGLKGISHLFSGGGPRADRGSLRHQCDLPPTWVAVVPGNKRRNKFGVSLPRQSVRRHRPIGGFAAPLPLVVAPGHWFAVENGTVFLKPVGRTPNFHATGEKPWWLDLTRVFPPSPACSIRPCAASCLHQPAIRFFMTVVTSSLPISILWNGHRDGKAQLSKLECLKIYKGGVQMD